MKIANSGNGPANALYSSIAHTGNGMAMPGAGATYYPDASEPLDAIDEARKSTWRGIGAALGMQTAGIAFVWSLVYLWHHF